MTDTQTKRENIGAVFDVDGTLLDSMGIWEDVGARYVKSLGKVPEEKLGEILFPMSLEEGAAYVKERYKVPFATDEIIARVLGIIRDYYYEEAPLKDGAKELLEALYRAGVPMVIATSSEREHVRRAFRRLGIDRYFEKILTCSEIGQGKSSPLIYQRAAETLGMSPGEIWVFEDAFHALRTAKSAGFHTVAVYDKASAKDQKALKNEAEVYVKSLREVLMAEETGSGLRAPVCTAL